jgi:heat shock protein HslJ
VGQLSTGRRLTAALIVIGIAAAALALAACSSADEATLEGAWTLTAAGDEALDAAAFTITAEFTADQLSGQAPVNSYSGGYTAGDDGSFTGGPYASTMMAGEHEAMAAEAAYFALLDRVTAWSVDGTTLTLSDDQGAALLTFERDE